MTTSSEDEYLSAEEEDEEKKRGPRTMAVASSHSPTLVSRLEGLQAHEASSIRTGRGDQNGESTSRGDGATEASEVAELEEDVSSLTIDRGSTCTARAESFDSEGCDVAMKDKNSRGEVGAEDREANERGGAAAGEGEVEYVGGLDNRDVSEDVTMKGGLVELSEEQVKELREHGNKVKKEGNDRFKSGDYKEAVLNYSEALRLYPPSSCQHEIAVCYANRAASYVKLEDHQSVVDDCTKALELEPDYLKAVMRRAQAYEALEKYEEALEDHKRTLELDPSQTDAKRGVTFLPEKIKEQHEKMKAEMMGKLRELGDAFLKPFGLSSSNFQFQQDPNTGGYSVNFKS